MPEYSSRTQRFLSAHDPELLAELLLGRPYSVLKRIIYPSPVYRTFSISKRDGSLREIDAPGARLKLAQRELASLLLELYGSGRPSAHGFIKGRSIVTNAAQHAAKKKFVFNIDLVDFFHTIHFGRVRGVFQSPPLSFPPNVAAVLAQVCCYNRRLPQGAPTSPVISNFICRSLDAELQLIARDAKATYTRYGDDITFSFTVDSAETIPDTVVQTNGSIVAPAPPLVDAIRKHGFAINEKKVRLRGRTRRMEVTGLTVNAFPNVRRSFVDEVRGMIHAWERHGLERAQASLVERYRRQLASRQVPRFERVLWGKLLFLKMVRGPEDKLYARLAERFNALSQRTFENSILLLPLSRRIRGEDDIHRAVFVVECFTESGPFSCSQGTAFLLEDGRLVTCEHVVRRNEQPGTFYSSLQGDAVKIICPERKFEAQVRVEAVFPDADVAVLKPLLPLPNWALPVQIRSAYARRSEQAIVAGYPYWNPSKILTIEHARVTSIFNKFGLGHFEVSCQIRKGNSGGPVLDHEYSLIGVAKEFAEKHGGNNAALSASELVKLVAG